MRVMILGSGTAVPDPERGSSGVAVWVDGSLVFLDLGSGSAYRAARFGVQVQDLDGVILSHLHPDHTGDLVPLLFAFRNPEWARSKPLWLWGPPGLAQHLGALESVYGSWIEPLGYERRVAELFESVVSVGSWQLKTVPVRHGLPAIACALIDSEGRKLVYSGDTEPCEELISLAAGADLLILECSFPEGRVSPGHLTPGQAGRIAARAGAKRLVLTHFYPACRGHDVAGACAKTYRGEITMAWDGLTLDV